MYNLIQFVIKYHFILLFLLIEGFSIFLLASNNQYQGNKINAFSQKYIGSLHEGLANISDFLKLQQTNVFLAEENAKLHSLLKKQNSGCLMKYAVRSGKPLKIKELAEIMSNIDNQDVAKVCNFGFYPYHKRERFKLNMQLETIPGWEPKKDLINGLKELINEHNEHKI